MTPNDFLDFDPRTPPHRGTLFWGGGGGGGGGGQNLFVYCGRCVCICTWVLKNFFVVYGPPNSWRGSRVPTPGTPSYPPPYMAPRQ